MGKTDAANVTLKTEFNFCWGATAIETAIRSDINTILKIETYILFQSTL